VCSEEELAREVNKFNNELSKHLADVDTHIPKVSNYVIIRGAVVQR